MASKKKQQNLYSSTQNKLAQYEEKQRRHEIDQKRGSKDNRLALIAGAAALLIAVGAQFGYTALHPAPKASTAASPSASSTPEAAPTNGPLVPSPSIAEGRVWNGSMKVNNASLGIQLYGDKAPQATANFIDLSKKGFYKNVSCHRLTTSGLFVLQCGDPKGDGTGGPGYSFGPIENAPVADNLGQAVYKKGVLAMANSGSAYSNGSQFFIVYADTKLMPNYTVFGEVTSGLTGLDPIIKAGVAAGQSSTTDGKPAVETKLGDIVLN